VVDVAAAGPATPGAHGGPAEPPKEASLPALKPDLQGDAGIVAVVLTRAAAAPLLTRGRHRASLTVELTVDKAPAANVVGVLRAGQPGKLPAIVIGAHYDHLGFGGHGSLAPDVREPHNGADDNASGVAALLLVARFLASVGPQLRQRDVWFVAFSGEELGVLGSAEFVKKLPPGLADGGMVAMLNMDMVGRMRDDTLNVLGVESAAEWRAIVAEQCASENVTCTMSGSGYGPSDHMPFYAAGVPVLHFFTGAHTDYHKPSDDVGGINATGIARVAAVVTRVTLALAGQGQTLAYRTSPAPATGGDVRSFGASLGTVPDYGGPPAGKTGVLLSGVRAGSPAEKAGLARGDILIGIDEHEIRSIEDFMFVLRAARPGQAATLVIERDGKKLSLPVVFGEARR
jgi:hypothetical protein